MYTVFIVFPFLFLLFPYYTYCTVNNYCSNTLCGLQYYPEVVNLCGLIQGDPGTSYWLPENNFNLDMTCFTYYASSEGCSKISRDFGNIVYIITAATTVCASSEFYTNLFFCDQPTLEAHQQLYCAVFGYYPLEGDNLVMSGGSIVNNVYGHHSDTFNNKTNIWNDRHYFETEGHFNRESSNELNHVATKLYNAGIITSVASCDPNCT